MQFLYITILLFSIIGIFILDRKRKLVLFSSERTKFAGAIVATIMFALLLDGIGVGFNVFYSNPEAILGLYVYPDIPIEEPILLFLITHSSLVTWRLLS